MAYPIVPADPTDVPPHTYATYPSLRDRSVLVSGGANGIGAGIDSNIDQAAVRAIVVAVNGLLS